LSGINAYGIYGNGSSANNTTSNNCYCLGTASITTSGAKTDTTTYVYTTWSTAAAAAKLL
jgi:hypothetical protein